MTSPRWLQRTLWALALIPLLAGVGFVAEQLDRGIVMRPLRKLAAKANVDIPTPTLTPEEKAEARRLAAAWRLECMEKFPALRVTPQPVPDAQNGYLMLWKLDQREAPSEAFRDLLSKPAEADPQEARRQLEARSDYLAHIEAIADMPTRSSMNLPAEYKGYISARDVKQATDTFLLMACVAAAEGNEAEALHRIRQTGNLIEHLSAIETPYLLSETVAILVNLARQDIALKTLLPKLGPDCDLKAWHQELRRVGDYRPQRFATLLRGEWQTGAQHLAHPLLAEATLSGELADGRSCAIAYASWMAEQIGELEAAKSWSDVDLRTGAGDFSHLKREARDLMSILVIGTRSWSKGLSRAAIVTAQHQAAMDLLVLEKAQGTLTAADTRQITPDPDKRPFLFDPKLRALSVSPDDADHGIDPITLPW